MELRRVGADRNSLAMADADATELQGDGQTLGENTRKKRERERGRGRAEERRGKTETRSSLLYFLLFKKQKWNGYERSEYEGKRRGWTATAVHPRSTAAR